jgi:hypothetical protein
VRETKQCTLGVLTGETLVWGSWSFDATYLEQPIGHPVKLCSKWEKEKEKEKPCRNTKKRKKNPVYKNQGGEPIHQNYKGKWEHKHTQPKDKTKANNQQNIKKLKKSISFWIRHYTAMRNPPTLFCNWVGTRHARNERLDGIWESFRKELRTGYNASVWWREAALYYYFLVLGGVKFIKRFPKESFGGNNTNLPQRAFW